MEILTNSTFAQCCAYSAGHLHSVVPIVQDKQHSLLFSGYSETEEVQMEQLQKYK